MQSQINDNYNNDLYVKQRTDTLVSKTKNIDVVSKSSAPICVQTNYSYNSISMRDDYVALYTTMMLIFLTGTFHSEKSNIVKNKNEEYHSLIFIVPEEFGNTTSEKIYDKQQELFKVLYENDYSMVLDGIKQSYKEILDEDYNNHLISQSEKLQREKIIDSINYEDIRNHINKYLLNAKPEINTRNNANQSFRGKVRQIAKSQIASFPVIVLISVSQRTRERNNKITQEAIEDKINKPVTDRTKFNTEQLKKCGVKDKDIEKHLKLDGSPNETGKKILKDNNLSFHGSDISENISENHKIPISELPEDASDDDLLNVDVSLPPELQEIADMPIGMGDPDLMSDIMADLPENSTPDESLLAHVKGVVMEIMGM